MLSFLFCRSVRQPFRKLPGGLLIQTEVRRRQTERPEKMGRYDQKQTAIEEISGRKAGRSPDESRCRIRQEPSVQDEKQS